MAAAAAKKETPNRMRSARFMQIFIRSHSPKCAHTSIAFKTNVPFYFSLSIASFTEQIYSNTHSKLVLNFYSVQVFFFFCRWTTVTSTQLLWVKRRRKKKVVQISAFIPSKTAVLRCDQRNCNESHLRHTNHQNVMTSTLGECALQQTDFNCCDADFASSI